MLKKDGEREGAKQKWRVTKGGTKKGVKMERVDRDGLWGWGLDRNGQRRWRWRRGRC